MANVIYRGEKIGIAGELKDGQVVTTDYQMVCQVLSASMHLIKEVALTVDTSTSKYVGTIDTSDLLGEVNFRFVARTQGGDIIVSNCNITKFIKK